ncbi:GCN5-related N-acetyltransferase [Ferrimonas balearica DSM 9799]|uniref:GCN5-related N-acetyltransferase n=1 Tax=Ferrimonas balearica (strain DSM 9799 / CCM 4581 / KCTC 23876 / PAT) TaxID=550540 RepID=E1SRS7_FERBD|nr:GNAT family N-acetyltransferase [Ferrimonas balearica]ADN74896.1 GCN5-related N-acetyltransferase [Ferrimonas balearica DSM 9799]
MKPYTLLRPLMTILIDTPRLQMRHFTPDDADAVLAFSGPEVTRYTGDDGAIQNLDDARRVIREIWQAEYQRHGYARYALVHKASQRVIGFCGLKYEPHLAGADLGYRMLPEYWGQGLGREAAEAALRYGQQVLGLDPIYAEVVEQNRASRRIIEGLGMVWLCQFEDAGETVHRYRTPA